MKILLAVYRDSDAPPLLSWMRKNAIGDGDKDGSREVEKDEFLVAGFESG